MTDVFVELAQLGTATIHEAAGRAPVVDIPLIQILPGSRAAGPARTVSSGQGGSACLPSLKLLVTKTRSPQTTGDDQPAPGTSAFQRTFLLASLLVGKLGAVARARWPPR